MTGYSKTKARNYSSYNSNDPIQKAIGIIYKNEIIELSKKKSGEKKVLDYACGPGRYLNFFPINLSVDFVDPSFHAIKILNEKIIIQKSEEFHKTICSKIENIKSDYDIIFSFGLIGEHISFSKDLLNLFIDRLKSDSKLIISIDLLNPQSKSFLRSLRDIADTNLRIYSFKLPLLKSNRSFIPEIIECIDNKKIISYDIYPLVSAYLDSKESTYRHSILEINVK